MEKKVGDITKEGTQADIEAHLKAILAQLEHVTAEIRRSRQKNDYTLILHNTTAMAALQVSRLSRWLNEQHDMIAWVARNLLELNLLLRYALASEDNLKRLMADYIVDTMQIDKGFMGLNNDPAHQEPYQQRIKYHQDYAVQNGLALEKMAVKPSDIAKGIGMKAEYDAFFKINSKYVHPTSWRLIGSPTATATLDVKNVFLAQAQLYALDILNRVSTSIGIPQPVSWRVVVLPDP